MNASKRPTRLFLLFAGMAALLLPAARCGQRTNSAAIQGSSLEGSGPSSGIAVRSGAGVPWSVGSQPLGPVSQPLLDMINGHRQGLGLTPLLAHDGMAEVAKAHTQDMQNRNFFSIVNPDGVDLYQRMVSSTPRIDFDNAWAFVVQPHSPVGGSAAAAVVFQTMLDNTVTRALIEKASVTHFVSYFHLPPSPNVGTWIFAQNVRP